jgi:hypothetical protein
MSDLDQLIHVPEADLRRELWLKGDLSYILLPDGQTRAYDFIQEVQNQNPDSRKPAVVVTHRGAGKSFLLATIGVERCIKYPGQLVRFGGPSYKQAVEILSESLPKILEHCPSDIKRYETEQKIEFKNPRWPEGSHKSIFWKFGSNRETIEAQRGLRSDMLLLDEVRDWDDLQYALSEVLFFQTARRYRPQVVAASTPPKSVGHYFWQQLVPKAIRNKAYFELNANDNLDFAGTTDYDELLDACDGPKTVAWKREALCQRISDENILVVPEFQARRPRIVRHHEKPAYFYDFCSADLGFKDHSAFLYAYTDFLARKLVVEREYCDHYKATSELAESHKIIQKALHQGTMRAGFTAMYADATEQQRYDLEHDHHLFFTRADKYDRDAGIAAMREALQNDRILIDPSCQFLIYQLEAGVWKMAKDGKKVDLQRTKFDPQSDKQLGHLDAVMSLCYLWRMARDYLHLNPYPTDTHISSDQFVPPYADAPKQKPLVVTSGPIVVTNHPVG